MNLIQHVFITLQLTILLKIFTMIKSGRLAQLARAPARHAGGQGFESLSAHMISIAPYGFNHTRQIGHGINYFVRSHEFKFVC